jgi:hypothetical protein
MKRYCLLAAFSGCAWALIAIVLSLNVFGKLIAGGLAASPLIGLFIGLVYLPAYKLPSWAQGLLALLTLYIAVALFGCAVGVYDALRAIPNRGSGEVILQQVLAAVIGITVSGYVLVLWPLAFLNHRLLNRAYNPAR